MSVFSLFPFFSSLSIRVRIMTSVVCDMRIIVFMVLIGCCRFVPQDVPSLIHLFGSNTTFVDQLDTFFERSVSQNETFLPNEYYWAGNEPDIQAPFLFPYASRPDLTQKWARWVADNRYSSLPNGLGG